MDVEYSRKFLKSADHLPAQIVALADQKESLFKTNPFHPSLETHKLHGKDAGAWAFSINRKFRIKFVFLGHARPAGGGARVLFLDVGTHDVYR